MTLPLAQTPSQQQLWRQLQPVNRVAASDTYKRTMSGSSNLFANTFAAYTLAARKALSEEGADSRYIMAGIEKIIYPWFLTPITKEEIDTAREFFTTKSAVKKFPEQAWQKVLDNNGYLPINIWSLPGGQTLLVKDGKHVPLMTVEGIGALASHLEPALEHIYAPLIQATKARLFSDVVGKQFAEFGLRSDQNPNNHTTLLMALYVGGGFQLTSNDLAALLFPEYFKDIGTMGHEFIMAYQRDDTQLATTQAQGLAAFVDANDRSALLPDVIDTVKSGLPAILDLTKKYQGTTKIIIPRFDSGDVSAQCIIWKKMTLAAGIPTTKIVVEDGYTPTKARQTKEAYKNAGFNPDDIIVGAGGYFHDKCTRDTASLAYKRSATEHDIGIQSSIKFSNSPGKESLPGRIRVYARDKTLVVAQAEETIDATPLMHKIVDNGHIVYTEDLHTQHQRANATWNAYDTIKYSPAITHTLERRTKERDDIVKQLR